MFETIIVQPVFNLLLIIYSILPGHNFGLAIILFTILVRILMNPLVKKQLHHSKAMRDLQPEIDAIKKNAKGDKQKAAELTMELYKERGISPFSSLGTIAIQVIVLIGLYTGLRQVANDPSIILSNSYEWIRNIGTLKEVALDIERFDFSLFGLVDLSRAAGSSAGFYLPGFLLVVGSAISQYFMGKQTLPDDKNARSLRKILKEFQNGGDKVKQSEVQAIFGQSLKYLIPLLIFLFTYSLPSALALYWFAAGAVGYIQQKRILELDEKELLSTKTTKKS
jgi:YidC/Oxa1 family membrane protein insertase